MTSISVRGALLAAMLLSIAILPSSLAHATGVTSCPSASQVESDWEDASPVAQCVIGEGAKVCRTWFSICKKLVREAVKCYVGQAAGTAKLEKARCKLASVIDKKACRQGATDGLKQVKLRAKFQKENATTACAAYVNQCAASCEM